MQTGRRKHNVSSFGFKPQKTPTTEEILSISEAKTRGKTLPARIMKIPFFHGLETYLVQEKLIFIQSNLYSIFRQMTLFLTASEAHRLTFMGQTTII